MKSSLVPQPKSQHNEPGLPQESVGGSKDEVLFSALTLTLLAGRQERHPACKTTAPKVFLLNAAWAQAG